MYDNAFCKMTDSPGVDLSRAKESCARVVAPGYQHVPGPALEVFVWNLVVSQSSSVTLRMYCGVMPVHQAHRLITFNAM
jgi:hypothetical protein